MVSELVLLRPASAPTDEGFYVAVGKARKKESLIPDLKAFINRRFNFPQPQVSVDEDGGVTISGLYDSIPEGADYSHEVFDRILDLVGWIEGCVELLISSESAAPKMFDEMPQSTVTDEAIQIEESLKDDGEHTGANQVLDRSVICDVLKCDGEEILQPKLKGESIVANEQLSPTAYHAVDQLPKSTNNDEINSTDQRGVNQAESYRLFAPSMDVSFDPGGKLNIVWEVINAHHVFGEMLNLQPKLKLSNLKVLGVHLLNNATTLLMLRSGFITKAINYLTTMCFDPGGFAFAHVIHSTNEKDVLRENGDLWLIEKSSEIRYLFAAAIVALGVNQFSPPAPNHSHAKLGKVMLTFDPRQLFRELTKHCPGRFQFASISLLKFDEVTETPYFLMCSLDDIMLLTKVINRLEILIFDPGGKESIFDDLMLYLSSVPNIGAQWTAFGITNMYVQRVVLLKLFTSEDELKLAAAEIPYAHEDKLGILIASTIHLLSLLTNESADFTKSFCKMCLIRKVEFDADVDDAHDEIIDVEKYVCLSKLSDVNFVEVECKEESLLKQFTVVICFYGSITCLEIFCFDPGGEPMSTTNAWKVLEYRVTQFELQEVSLLATVLALIYDKNGRPPQFVEGSYCYLQVAASLLRSHEYFFNERHYILAYLLLNLHRNCVGLSQLVPKENSCFYMGYHGKHGKRSYHIGAYELMIIFPTRNLRVSSLNLVSKICSLYNSNGGKEDFRVKEIRGAHLLSTSTTLLKLQVQLIMFYHATRLLTILNYRELFQVLYYATKSSSLRTRMFRRGSIVTGQNPLRPPLVIIGVCFGLAFKFPKSPVHICVCRTRFTCKFPIYLGSFVIVL